MKISLYIKDKIFSILIYVVASILLMLMLKIFHLNVFMIILVAIILSLTGIIIFLLNFFSKRSFYNSLINNMKLLDKKYLVLETMNKASTYEQSIVENCLYEINKSMIENVNIVKQKNLEFKEFVEIWIHEIKLPISSLMLKFHNSKNSDKSSFLSSVKKIDDLADEVLYYLRSENSEKDFLIKKLDLMQIVKNVIIKNKDDLLYNNITLLVDKIESFIYSDKKWLEYIINQILSNCIKYKKEENSTIKISCFEDEKKVKLEIFDNGIGIKKQDLVKVYDKSFTGFNGRKTTKSTGMGLYIVKNLIDKLGHKIEIFSEFDRFTKVVITVKKLDFFVE